MTESPRIPSAGAVKPETEVEEMRKIVEELDKNHQNLMRSWHESLARLTASSSAGSQGSSPRSEGTILLSRYEVELRDAARNKPEEPDQKEPEEPDQPSAAKKQKPLKPLNNGDNARNSQERQLRLLRKVLNAQKTLGKGKDKGWSGKEKGWPGKDKGKNKGTHPDKNKGKDKGKHKGKDHAHSD